MQCTGFIIRWNRLYSTLIEIFTLEMPDVVRSILLMYSEIYRLDVSHTPVPARKFEYNISVETPNLVQYCVQWRPRCSDCNPRTIGIFL
jgi:hypothetical protein